MNSFNFLWAITKFTNKLQGRLSELLSQMRMQRNQWNGANANEYTLDKGNV